MRPKLGALSDGLFEALFFSRCATLTSGFPTTREARGCATGQHFEEVS
jgi:hypothetical protein